MTHFTTSIMNQTLSQTFRESAYLRLSGQVSKTQINTKHKLEYHVFRIEIPHFIQKNPFWEAKCYLVSQEIYLLI